MNEKVRVEMVPTCLFCGVAGVSLYRGLYERGLNVAGVWDYSCCPKCGLIWLNPRPIPEDIKKVYAGHQCTHIYEPRSGVQYVFKKWVTDNCIAQVLGYSDVSSLNYAKWFVGKLLNFIPPLKDLGCAEVMFLDGLNKGRLLDVGCGNGEFLARMRGLGWEVLGVEPDEEAAKVAREEFGLQVIIGSLEEIDFPEFDAVTMNHVLEHLYDPISSLQKCYRVLKPGGTLVITTPNAESLGHRVFRESWLSLAPPQHLYLYSLKTIKTLVDKSGFSVKILRTMSRGAPSVWSGSRFIALYGENPKFYHLPLRMHIEGLPFWILEETIRLIWRKNVGEEILLIAKKPRMS